MNEQFNIYIIYLYRKRIIYWYIFALLLKTSLLGLVAELFGEEHIEPDVSNNAEDFVVIAWSGSCPSFSELVPMQLGEEQGEDQCKYNTECFIELSMFY